LNPKGEVPFICEANCTIFTDSEKILDDLAAREMSTLGHGEDRERTAAWRQILNKDLLPRAKKLRFQGKGDVQPILEYLNELVAGPFVSGEQLSTADVSGAPMFQRLFDADMVPREHGRLHAWWEAVSSRPTFKKTRLEGPSSYWWW